MNSSLNKAKRDKNDEFYTFYEDIEKEVESYVKHNPDVFRGKVVVLPCDDVGVSNFTQYFIDNFSRFGLKRLISSSYVEGGRGKCFYLTENGQGQYLLEGDGDFRSAEVSEMLGKADVVVTNPPFSLFREFIKWLNGKDFLVVGNVNAISYKEVFPLIKEGKVWLGASAFNKGLYFRVPDDFVYAENYRSGRYLNGVPVCKVNSICWFTSLPHEARFKPLTLNTMEWNLKRHKGLIRRLKVLGASSYVEYDNYKAIEVPFVSAIPSDYKGVMGVPITFLNSHCPLQFEILGSQRWCKGQEIEEVYRGNRETVHDDMKTLIDGKETYDRIFIRHR